MTDILTKNVLGLSSGIMATGIAVNTLKALPKMNIKTGQIKFPKSPVKNISKVGVETIIGTTLLSPTAKIISEI